MNKRTTSFVLLAIALLIMALVILNRQRDDIDDGIAPSAGNTGADRRATTTGDSGDSDAAPGRTFSHDRSDAMANIQSLKDIKREFDEILPAKYPDQYSSLCDANLKPGEVLILGGFKTADGQYEFNALQVHPSADPETPGSYRIENRSFVLSREQCAEHGLTDLLSPAPMRIQKSVVRPTSTLPQMLTNSGMVLSMPAVTAQSNLSANISIGMENQARAFSYAAEPGTDGESIRLRTRIESPGNAEP
jgi:hypothetical protein